MTSDVPDLTDDALSYDFLTSMREWRLQHPNATLREIEEALLDERWYRVRVCSKIWRSAVARPTGTTLPNA